MNPSRIPESSRIVFACTLCAVFFAAVLASGQSRETVELYRIERSLNANVVHYDANLTPEGDLHPSKPVVGYWILHEKGGKRQELTQIDKKMAYGFKVERDPGADFVTMRPSPNPKREIRVYRVNDGWRAETLINGQPAFLEKVYVKTKGSGLNIKVEYVEVFGHEIRSGDELYEKLPPP